jgi:DNA-binding transcriptional regulator of glucitol operon
MEEIQPQTGKYALTYGLLLGGISVIFAFMLYSVDMHYQGGAMVMSISLALTIAAIVFGMIQFRKENNGFMSLSQAMKVGVGIALVGGIIGIVFNQLMVNVIDPEMMTKAMEFQKAALAESTKMTPNQIDAQMEMGKKFSTRGITIAIGLIFSVVVGLVLSLISGLILKRTENLN